LSLQVTRIGVPGTSYLAILVTFYCNVVKLEDAYQNLDNQPLTQMPCVFSRKQLREETPALDADLTYPYSETLGVLPGLLMQEILGQ
jgi:hypothetical protein